ncbi:calcineurin subunit b [Quercus suber]|uniref:Calcineurin subunit b n=1 Tax=Quercus suber TaxID=58331 RepID=A0AAW0KED0_QUESU
MGNSSSMLTQYDIEEVQEHCNHTSGNSVTVPKCASLFIFQRLLRMLDGLNFKEFVAFLSAFSPRATLQQKVEFIFKVYDSDGNGKVTFSDMLEVLRDLSGQFISEQQREQVLTHVLEEAGYTKNSLLGLSDFMKVLCSFISNKFLSM